MSNKSKVLRPRGNAKSVTAAVQSVLEEPYLDAGRITTGKVSSKRLHQALAASYQVTDEMSVYPPVTPQEAEAFCRVHIKRCNMNLANAKDRGDKRAITHLERKLAVYQYLHKLAKEGDPPKLAIAGSVFCSGQPQEDKE